MITNEINIINEVEFNRVIEPSDWRYSAAIVGMKRYFDYHENSYFLSGRRMYYKYEDICNDELHNQMYYEFAQEYFRDKMHHLKIIEILDKNSLSDLDVKDINEKLGANTIMKKIFKGIKVDKDVREEQKNNILKLIEERKYEIIKDTYCHGISTYRKFINTSKLRGDKGEVCRLLGFYVDTGRKTKSISFGFDKDKRVSNDELEFDFIPFAFTKGRESIFINNNSDLNTLNVTNDQIKYYLEDVSNNISSWNTVFYSQSRSSIFNEFDVEVIKKKLETDYYESLIVRKNSIKIFEELVKNNRNANNVTSLDISLQKKIKLSDNYTINIMEEVTESIINNIYLDEWIEFVMKWNEKQENHDNYIINNLININVLMYFNSENSKLGGNMENKNYLFNAKKSATKTVQYLKNNSGENKIKGYRQRLTNVLIAKDYDRFVEILLQLSSYSEISYPFLHTLISNFEENKNLAYAFVNSLTEIDLENQGGEKNEK